MTYCCFSVLFSEFCGLVYMTWLSLNEFVFKQTRSSNEFWHVDTVPNEKTNHKTSCRVPDNKYFFDLIKTTRATKQWQIIDLQNLKVKLFRNCHRPVFHLLLPPQLVIKVARKYLQNLFSCCIKLCAFRCMRGPSQIQLKPVRPIIESESTHNCATRFVSILQLATSMTNWAQTFTGLLFDACVGKHQVRILVFDNYQTCQFFEGYTELHSLQKWTLHWHKGQFSDKCCTIDRKLMKTFI